MCSPNDKGCIKIDLCGFLLLSVHPCVTYSATETRTRIQTLHNTPQPIHEVSRFGLKSKTGLDYTSGKDLHLTIGHCPFRQYWTRTTSVDHQSTVLPIELTDDSGNVRLLINLFRHRSRTTVNFIPVDKAIVHGIFYVPHREGKCCSLLPQDNSCI